MAAEKEKLSILSKQVFINNVDKYTSKYIAEFLSLFVAEESYVPKEIVNQEEAKLFHNNSFQVVGTVTEKTEEPSSVAVKEYTNLTREELFHHLIESDVIVYNIYNESADQIEEASWAVSALHKEIDAFPRPKMFILISTVMTWALSMALDPNDPEISFTEEDYRRRKPHPNFKDHIAVEKLVVKLGKSNQSRFSTYVVASGLQYGMGEQAFHFFFKTSWLGEKREVPIFGDGSNIVPAVHINDLAGIVKNVIDRKPKPKYFIAVDESQNTIADIITAITFKLGPGKTKNVPKEDVFLTEELTQSEIDHLFVNLQMEAIFFDENFNKENFNINWVSKKGIVENINQIVEEYELIRGLLPLRICLLGPPAVGKSTVAEKICKHYKLHHVKLKETVSEAIANLEARVHVVEAESTAEDGSHGAQELLETLRKNMDKNGGRLDQPYIIQTMKGKLNSTACRNQGFVLDGFPETHQQAKELFCVDQAEDERLRKKKIIPEFVFFLDATDEFLEERVLNLPESMVQGTLHCVEKYFERLETFRKNNSVEKTVLKYFDELEIHAKRLETGSDDLDNVLVMEKVIEIVGTTRNYGSTTKDMEEQWRQAENRLREKEAGLDEAKHKKEEHEQRAQEQEEWNRCLEDDRRQEEALLMSESAPFRQYLMNSVLPTVIQGCLEICELRPEDPIHYLAVYLRKKPTKSAIKDELQQDEEIFPSLDLS